MTLRLTFRANAPAIGVLLGAGALATGAGLAVAGHEAALIAVGGSNLSMVLALSGASLMLLMSAIWCAQDTKVKKECYIPETEGPIQTAIKTLMVGAILYGGLCYGGLHHGVGTALALTNLTAEQSLLTQAGLIFAIAIVLSGRMFNIKKAHDMTTAEQVSVNNIAKQHHRKASTVPPVTLKEAFKEKWAYIMFNSFCISLIPTTVIVGPVLSLCMGSAAATTAEAISMEIIIAIGLPFALTMTVIAMKKGDINLVQATN
ncbi:MAG: hypothetical protein JSS50_02010 [Proteobacteria bacterium]|nr:hypothetical protein [Pseudomonadota bacterium]